MGLLIHVIIVLAILCLVLFLGRFICQQLGAPSWVMTVLNVVAAIIMLVWLLDLAGWANVGFYRGAR